MTRGVQSQDYTFAARNERVLRWQKSPERLTGFRVVSGFLSRRSWNPMELETAMEEGVMWIAFFSIASAAAIVLSVAAVMIQASQGEVLRSE